jgi:hypothetical protein
VNDVALSTRGYDLRDGGWGILVVSGEVAVRHARVGRLA